MGLGFAVINRIGYYLARKQVEEAKIVCNISIVLQRKFSQSLDTLARFSTLPLQLLQF